jgi:PilZ domain-containing protein
LIERRNGRRFEVDWPIKVEPMGDHQLSIEGIAQNISSGGALFLLSKPVAAGTKISVSIKLPFKKNNWMKYSASVVRATRNGAAFATAVKFEGAKPMFGK